jgi:hypothetical protein
MNAVKLFVILVCVVAVVGMGLAFDAGLNLGQVDLPYPFNETEANDEPIIVFEGFYLQQAFENPTDLTVECHAFGMVSEDSDYLGGEMFCFPGKTLPYYGVLEIIVAPLPIVTPTATNTTWEYMTQALIVVPPHSGEVGFTVNYGNSYNGDEVVKTYVFTDQSVTQMFPLFRAEAVSVVRQSQFYADDVREIVWFDGGTIETQPGQIVVCATQCGVLYLEDNEDQTAFTIQAAYFLTPTNNYPVDLSLLPQNGMSVTDDLCELKRWVKVNQDELEDESLRAILYHTAGSPSTMQGFGLDFEFGKEYRNFLKGKYDGLTHTKGFLDDLVNENPELTSEDLSDRLPNCN